MLGLPPGFSHDELVSQVTDVLLSYAYPTERTTPFTVEDLRRLDGAYTLAGALGITELRTKQPLYNGSFVPRVWDLDAYYNERLQLIERLLRRNQQGA